MNAYSKTQENLLAVPKTWLVTGAAGFIGAHLVEALLRLNQQVVGLDNFSSGTQENLEAIKAGVSQAQWKNFHFIKGDITHLEDCRRAMIFSKGVSVDYVLHQAALCSVALSIEDPLKANAYNIDGFLNVLVAARDVGVSRIVYASSSAVYGDARGCPATELETGAPLSPYAATKQVDELYAGLFARLYKMEIIGLRYFNIFGARQNPEGDYAAVIPKWMEALIQGAPVSVFGDGKTSRDFCHIDNVVQANILATQTGSITGHHVYNIGTGQSMSLNDLYHCLRGALEAHIKDIPAQPRYEDFRAGDIRHSEANIDQARQYLGYEPETDFKGQLKKMTEWRLSFPGR